MKFILLFFMNGTSVGKWLGFGHPTVFRSVVRGEKLVQDMKLNLVA